MNIVMVAVAIFVLLFLLNPKGTEKEDMKLKDEINCESCKHLKKLNKNSWCFNCEKKESYK